MLLTSDQIHAFCCDGYLIVPQFFAAAETQRLRLEMERLVQEDRGRNVMPSFTGKINYQITPLADKSDLFRDLPTRPDVLITVEQAHWLPGAALAGSNFP